MEALFKASFTQRGPFQAALDKGRCTIAQISSIDSNARVSILSIFFLKRIFSPKDRKYMAEIAISNGFTLKI
ncbi:MAG: hypothetical protein MJZ50_01600 [Treponema sp.]|nr:hypothetical protein [Treponema sp.]